jgi:hypothetical protein
MILIWDIREMNIVASHSIILHDHTWYLTLHRIRDREGDEVMRVQSQYICNHKPHFKVKCIHYYYT